MDTIHRMLEKELGKLPYKALADLVSKKLEAKGQRLSKKTRKRLEATFRRNEFPGTILLRGGRRQKQERTIDIEITSEEIERIEDWFVADNLYRMIEPLFEEVAELIYGTLKKSWPGHRRVQNQDMDGFRRRLRKAWEAPLERLQMLLTACQEYGASVNQESRGKGKASYAVEALTRLHARACQVAGEILTLLQNGFADGAMARWRTLHEITVVAFFIAEHGDDLAERYLLHHVVESWRAARDYVQCQERMGYPPLSPKQLSKIEGQFNKLIGRFGTPFRTHYGWAAQQLSLPSPTFGDIEKAVGIGHFRSHYRMASHPVHASPHGVLFSLAVVGDSAPLLAGPSDTGLPDPGWLTANSLVQVSAAIGGLSPTIDNIVTLMVMERMKKEVSATLDAAWEQIQRRPIPGPAL